MTDEDEYYVEAPLVGKLVGYVKASSEEEAIQRFLEGEWRCEDPAPENGEKYVQEVEFSELEVLSQVNEGNAYYSPIGRAWAQKEEQG